MVSLNARRLGTFEHREEYTWPHCGLCRRTKSMSFSNWQASLQATLPSVDPKNSGRAISKQPAHVMMPLSNMQVTVESHATSSIP